MATAAVGLASTVTSSTATRRPPARPRQAPDLAWIVALVVLLLIAAASRAYVLTRPQKVLVPTVVNLPQQAAQQRILAAGFTPNVISQPSKYPNGIVIAQNPLGDEGEEWFDRDPDRVHRSRHHHCAVGRPVDAGSGGGADSSGGPQVSQIMAETSTSVPAGEATRTYPVGGASVSRGSKVILYMSSGLAVPMSSRQRRRRRQRAHPVQRAPGVADDNRRHPGHSA